MKIKFDKIKRVVWILMSNNGCVLAHGHPDPARPPYHLDPLTDRIPAIVHAPNKATLREAKRVWNGSVRASCASRGVKNLKNLLFVHERKVRITIEEA